MVVPRYMFAVYRNIKLHRWNGRQTRLPTTWEGTQVENVFHSDVLCQQWNGRMDGRIQGACLVGKKGYAAGGDKPWKAGGGDECLRYCDSLSLSFKGSRGGGTPSDIGVTIQ